MRLTPLNPPRDRRSPFHSQGMLVTSAERFVVVAGQVGVRPDGTIGEDIVAQTTIAMENVAAVLAEAEMGWDSVVSLTIHLTDDSHIRGFTEAAGAFLDPDPTQRPAATLTIHPQLANPALLVQIEATAVG